MRAIDYLVSLMVFEFILILLFCSSAVPIVLFLEFIEQHATGPVHAFIVAFNTSIYVMMVVGILAASWVAHDAARRFALGTDPFWKALTASLGQARFNASYLPVVGKWMGIEHSDTPSMDGPIE